MKLILTEPFIPLGFDHDDIETRKIKAALARLGYYTPNPHIGMDETRSADLRAAISAFRQDRNIPDSPWIMPQDATIISLNKELAVNRNAERYIWRTMKDTRVRDDHAHREGQIFTWGNPPPEGHPGDAPNCRCWPEPIGEGKRNCKEEENAWINAGAILFIAEQTLQKAEQEKHQLEERKSQKQVELLKIEEQIEKEKKNKREAQNKGAAIGAAVGAAIGAPGGLAGSMMVAGIGIGVGSNIGRFSEEIGDAVSDKSKTDLSLILKRIRLLKELQALQRQIEELAREISTILMPEVEKAQWDVDETQAAFLACKIRNKK